MVHRSAAAPQRRGSTAAVYHRDFERLGVPATQRHLRAWRGTCRALHFDAAALAGQQRHVVVIVVNGQDPFAGSVEHVIFTASAGSRPRFVNTTSSRASAPLSCAEARASMA